VLQTESPRGVANAEDIYSLPGVDRNLRRPGRSAGADAQGRRHGSDDEEFEAMLQRIIAIGKKTGTPTGMHVMDPAVALKRAEQGMQFIAVGSDLRFMTACAQDVLKTLRPTASGRPGAVLGANSEFGIRNSERLDLIFQRCSDRFDDSSFPIPNSELRIRT